MEQKLIGRAFEDLKEEEMEAIQGGSSVVINSCTITVNHCTGTGYSFTVTSISPQTVPITPTLTVTYTI